MSTDCDGSVSIATSGQANLGKMTANGDNVRAFAHRMARLCGTDMRLVNMSRPVRRAVELNGPDLVLEFHNSTTGLFS